jgi:hypothetical protein
MIFSGSVSFHSSSIHIILLALLCLKKYESVMLSCWDWNCHVIHVQTACHSVTFGLSMSCWDWICRAVIFRLKSVLLLCSNLICHVVMVQLTIMNWMSCCPVHIHSKVIWIVTHRQGIILGPFLQSTYGTLNLSQAVMLLTHIWKCLNLRRAMNILRSFMVFMFPHANPRIVPQIRPQAFLSTSFPVYSS